MNNPSVREWLVGTARALSLSQNGTMWWWVVDEYSPSMVGYRILSFSLLSGSRPDVYRIYVFAGCAFVTFAARSNAQVAIKAMHHSQTMEVADHSVLSPFFLIIFHSLFLLTLSLIYPLLPSFFLLIFSPYRPWFIASLFPILPSFVRSHPPSSHSLGPTPTVYRNPSLWHSLVPLLSSILSSPLTLIYRNPLPFNR